MFFYEIIQGYGCWYVGSRSYGYERLWRGQVCWTEEMKDLKNKISNPNEAPVIQKVEIKDELATKQLACFK